MSTKAKKDVVGEGGGGRTPRPDAGSTFVEILITIVLIGTVVIGILTATRAQVVASRTSREAARVESALLAASDRVERAPRSEGYTCDLSAPVEAAVQLKLTIPAGKPVGDYYDIEYEHLTATGWVDGACPGSPSLPFRGPGGSYQSNLVQRIAITMIGPDTGLRRTLEVLKGDV